MAEKKTINVGHLLDLRLEVQDALSPAWTEPLYGPVPTVTLSWKNALIGTEELGLVIPPFEVDD